MSSDSSQQKTRLTNSRCPDIERQGSKDHDFRLANHQGVQKLHQAEE